MRSKRQLHIFAVCYMAPILVAMKNVADRLFSSERSYLEEKKKIVPLCLSLEYES